MRPVCAQCGATGRPSSAAAPSNAGTCSYTGSAPAARVLEWLAVAWYAAAASRGTSEQSVHLKYVCLGIQVFRYSDAFSVAIRLVLCWQRLLRRCSWLRWRWCCSQQRRLCTIRNAPRMAACSMACHCLLGGLGVEVEELP